MAEETTTPKNSGNLEAGTYELLRNRIVNHSAELSEHLNSLNTERKEVFGTIETKVMATERITTENNCIPWDMIALGDKFLFGYNVNMGLRKDVKITDVFSYFEFKDHAFHEHPITDILNDSVFEDDYNKLYKYYKNTQFLRFTIQGINLHMVFRIGKEEKDIKTFKWEIKGDKLIYVDNRSDNEYVFPTQHEFEWTKTRREHYRDGLHPHISIEERVFVETVGGDLTVKIEDNTEDGEGIYSEDVLHKQQTLEDGEIHYAVLGHIIIMKITPYQEESRYLVFNEKLKEVKRIDAISESCVLLPDNHGLIFSNGYYLQSGEYKTFDLELSNMLFERRITSINGEDYIYVFYNRAKGIYLLLNYNIISQKVENPIVCHGFTIFENGEMCLFKADEEPKKHHAVQIWQTPFTGPNFKAPEKKKSSLQKIGNKDVVRAMAECQEIINLVNRDEIYGDLYLDVIKKATDIIDTYYWIGDQKEFDLKEPLEGIRKVAESAVDEYEKVRRIRENSQLKLKELSKSVSDILKRSKASFGTIDAYVKLLGEIRESRGEVISSKDLRYINVPKLDEYDGELAKASDVVSESCVRFLMQEHALNPFKDKVSEYQTKIDEVAKVVEADELIQVGEKIANELDLLIETVSNLKITDATQTTQIIENISEIYGEYNQIKGSLVKKRKSLLSDEGKAEFNATLKLLEQSVANYLDISDTPEQCQEYLTKLIVQIEELEGKFSEFDEFIDIVASKREEVYNAFESKKLYLTEQRSKKSNQLFQTAERVLSAVRNKAGGMKSKEQINSYFASDLMVEKVRSIAKDLVEMDETVKADDLSSQLKTIKEDVLRQLKDKLELFADGDNIISMGNHKFYTNKLELDLSMVVRNSVPNFHLAGTDFFEEINHEGLKSLADLWDQNIVSENKDIYRGEFLAYSIFNQLTALDGSLSVDEYLSLSDEDRIKTIQKEMTARFQEGYVKGIHEFDANLILDNLIELYKVAGVLKFDPTTRAAAMFYWNSCIESEIKEAFNNQIKSAAIILSIFPESREFEALKNDIAKDITNYDVLKLFGQTQSIELASYLVEELGNNDLFSISSEAASGYQEFTKHLKSAKAEKKYQDSIKSLLDQPDLAVRLIFQWLNSYVSSDSKQSISKDHLSEIATLLLYNHFNENQVLHTNLDKQLEGLKGDHKLLEEDNYTLQINKFTNRLNQYNLDTVPRFEQLQQLKKELTENYKEELKLHEFKPRVLASFVRNKLIDKVYFPLIGANLAKQMGSAGDNKRTDLMGLLLLISPPGYGKTTLMEYIASRLGVIFMKINGPAIGHEVTSLDPADAPNAASAEELQKLNLSFEMGNNVMIYLDDIQHCNPELLQKFISMCDGQRKIEGVYKGKTKTYDFRGKKVCVVMAGNPYTESGEKFQIPDMLTNRADTYNLGDVIGENEEVFKLSYIENCLTSNPILGKLVSRSIDDVQSVIKMAETGTAEGLKFEGNHTADELQEYVAIIKHLLRARDAVLKVNLLYIKSAAMADEYRVEPPFKLQGSYRDMNKMAEKILPMMNEEEVDTIIVSHYENEAQTLTSNAEANLLKLKELQGILSEADEERWALILNTFLDRQKKLGFGQNAQLANSLDTIADTLTGLTETIKNKKVQPRVFIQSESNTNDEVKAAPKTRKTKSKE
ncbi:DNA repair ATPase [Reichenbachiella versicolor]|uniref:DNA repair ATPase n=1 Tax=Reichenbachiella versicolor TaxID=1821036 RepID=UPI000D6E3333|nr:DNA repair ATPase [Reichenbachiella versicolor]